MLLSPSQAAAFSRRRRAGGGATQFWHNEGTTVRLGRDALHAGEQGHGTVRLQQMVSNVVYKAVKYLRRVRTAGGSTGFARSGCNRGRGRPSWLATRVGVQVRPANVLPDKRARSGNLATTVTGVCMAPRRDKIQIQATHSWKKRRPMGYLSIYKMYQWCDGQERGSGCYAQRVGGTINHGYEGLVRSGSQAAGSEFQGRGPGRVVVIAAVVVVVGGDELRHKSFEAPASIAAVEIINRAMGKHHAIGQFSSDGDGSQ
ncbi:hypothetical protein F5X96DRAFT_669967 [Biscogniauxia mediterranea]|nr:hypothetical protein F5X96DRAFT_669967 [Biscogniauxia mediterranea]